MASFSWRGHSSMCTLVLQYGISYRDLEEMMAERGVVIDHTTLYRWVQYYAPKLKNRLDGIRNVTPKAGLLMRLTSK